MTPENILDFESTGFLGGFQAPRTDVGISEWALRSTTGREFKGGHTDILVHALSTAKSAEDYHKLITTGPIVWQHGVAREGDVLAGVHERHFAATQRALSGGPGLASERQAIRDVQRALASGESIGGWNIAFDMGLARQVAKRHGISDFESLSSKAFAEGRIVEMSKPVEEFLFKLAGEGRIELSHIRASAKAKVASGQWGPKDIQAAALSELIQPHTGFRELFERQPGVTYQELEDILHVTPSGQGLFGVQGFGVGRDRPEMRYVRGRRQQVIAEAINPGFLNRKVTTQIERELTERTVSGITHTASFDTGLSGLLYEIFSDKDPWKKLEGYGVRSKEQFVTQWKSALERDLRDQLLTYQGELAKQAPDLNYMRKVWSGAREAELRASEVAAAAAARGPKFKGLRATFKGAQKQIMDAAYRHPTATAAVSLVGALILADAFIPEDNRLEGRRQNDSRYTQISGITFEGVGAPAAHFLTDFGSGRSHDNATTQVRAWRLARMRVDRTFSGFSVGEIEKAQSIWGGAHSQTRQRALDRSEYNVVQGRKLSIPGVKPDAWLGVVDLRDYNVKVTDADTVNIHRKGILNLLDRPISVRLAGIDAPEVHSSWPLAMQPGGLQSGEYLRKVIESQTNMRLLIDPGRTTYGRHVGVLSGDVHPNINLKLVSAGAAAALPPGGYARQSIIAGKAWERAEALASTSGLGMWSSKGWQAKHLVDAALTNRVTNTVLAQRQRVAETTGYAALYDLVSSLHESPGGEFWSEAESIAAREVVATINKDRLWPVNQRIKDYGWDRGMREGGGWNIVTDGISPSDLPGSNVSAFGSGWTTEGAELVLRNADPLRNASRYLPRLEPLMAPAGGKSVSADILQLMRDRFLAAEKLTPGVDTTVAPVRTAYKEIIQTRAAPQVLDGLKPSVRAELHASATATSVRLTGPKAHTWRRQKFLGSLYSAQLAVAPPERPLNALKAVRGEGFRGSWQERAWAAFRSGQIEEGHAAVGFLEVQDVLCGHGFSKEEALGIVRRYGLERAVHKSANRVSETKGIWNRVSAFKDLVWRGEVTERVTNWADNFIAGEPRSWAEFKAFIKDEFRLRQVLYRNTVGKAQGTLSKFGAFGEFFAGFGSPIEVLSTPSLWREFGKKKPGWIQKGLDKLRGPRAPSKVIRSGKAWILSNLRGTSLRNLRGLYKGGSRLLHKMGGKFFLGISMIGAVSASNEYENRALGLGVEAASITADLAVWGATSGALKAVGAGVGTVAGGAIGAAIGGLIGNAPGAVTGGKIGAVAGRVVGLIVGEIAAMALGLVVGDVVREAGGYLAKKRNAPADAQEYTDVYGPQIPGLSTYGGTDQYLQAGHGIQGRPEFSGFGGGLKPLREARALGDTLGRASEKIVGSIPAPRPARLVRKHSRLQPTAGLVNKVLWGNRKRMPRARSAWPVQWEKRRKVRPHGNQTRMILSAA